MNKSGKCHANESHCDGVEPCSNAVTLQGVKIITFCCQFLQINVPSLRFDCHLNRSLSLSGVLVRWDFHFVKSGGSVEWFKSDSSYKFIFLPLSWRWRCHASVMLRKITEVLMKPSVDDVKNTSLFVFQVINIFIFPIRVVYVVTHNFSTTLSFNQSIIVKPVCCYFLFQVDYFLFVSSFQPFFHSMSVLPQPRMFVWNKVNGIGLCCWCKRSQMVCGIRTGMNGSGNKTERWWRRWCKLISVTSSGLVIEQSEGSFD